MQHVSDSWHATFGSIAITIVNNVFESSTKDFSEDEACIHFAQEQLDTLQFLYGDATAKVCRTFILATDTNLIYLAILPSSSRTSHSPHSHSSLQDAIKVPSLGDAKCLSNQLYGALAMSSAAVYSFCSYPT